MIDERTRQIAHMLASKAAAGKPVMDPVSRYLLGVKGGGADQSLGAAITPAGGAASPPAASPAPTKAKPDREAVEAAIMQRLMGAMVYSPSPAIEQPPGFVTARQLGMSGAYDESQGGYLHGLDARRVSPSDIAWLQQHLAAKNPSPKAPDKTTDKETP